MADLPVEKRFGVLCEITRAQHFAWRQAVTELYPGTDPQAVVERMWKITGVQTAKAYLKRLDKEAPLARQVADSIVWSSLCMGEDAVSEAGAEGKDEAFVSHQDCPWFHWHQRLELLAEDRPGCDIWFQSTIDTVNEALGSKLKMETREALPDGGRGCVRRIWNES